MLVTIKKDTDTREIDKILSAPKSRRAFSSAMFLGKVKPTKTPIGRNQKWKTIFSDGEKTALQNNILEEDVLMEIKNHRKEK